MSRGKTGYEAEVCIALFCRGLSPKSEHDASEVSICLAAEIAGVACSGKLEVLSIAIEPEVVDPDDIETLTDILTAAVNEAIKKVNSVNSEEMGKVTGGLNVPGLPGLF